MYHYPPPPPPPLTNNTNGMCDMVVTFANPICVESYLEYYNVYIYI